MTLGATHGDLDFDAVRDALLDRTSRLETIQSVKVMPRLEALRTLERLLIEVPPQDLDQDLVRLALRTASEIGATRSAAGSPATFLESQTWADIFYARLSHEEAATRGQALVCLDALAPTFDQASCSRVAQMLEDPEPLLLSRALEFIILRPEHAGLVAQRALELLDASSDSERQRWSAERKLIKAGQGNWESSRERLVRVRAASVRMLGLRTDVDFELFQSLDPSGKDCFAEALVGRLRILALPHPSSLSVKPDQLDRGLDLLIEVAQSSQRAERARELAIGLVFSARYYEQTPSATKERLDRKWSSWQATPPEGEGMVELIDNLTRIEESL